MKRDLALKTPEEVYKLFGSVSDSINALVESIEEFKLDTETRREVDRLIKAGGDYAIEDLLAILRKMSLSKLFDNVENIYHDVMYYNMDKEVLERYLSWSFDIFHEVESNYGSTSYYREMKAEGRWLVKALKEVKKKGDILFKNPDEDIYKLCEGRRSNCDSCFNVCCKFNENYEAEKKISQALDLDKFFDEREARRRNWQ